jgi:hypothetical protein
MTLRFVVVRDGSAYVLLVGDGLALWTTGKGAFPESKAELIIGEQKAKIQELLRSQLPALRRTPDASTPNIQLYEGLISFIFQYLGLIEPSVYPVIVSA